VLSNARVLPNPEGPADRARELWPAAGLHEIVTWAFVPRAALHTVSGEGKDKGLADGIAVKNPISADYEVMRTSLLPGLAEALRRNLARGNADARLFEVGPIVRRATGVNTDHEEPTYAAGILAGRAGGWLKPGEALDFFDAKRVVEDCLVGFGVTDASYAAPGGAPLLPPGRVGRDLPARRAARRRRGRAAPGPGPPPGSRSAQLLFRGLRRPAGGGARAPADHAPPRFPAVTRDISFWIDAAVTAADQRGAFARPGEPLLRSLAVLEDFRDPKYAPAGKKGMLWTMTYRADDRTLTDEEVDAAHARVVKGLTDEKQIQIR
jgi:phenylalanyl-tRNA synthetase beta chain